MRKLFIIFAATAVLLPTLLLSTPREQGLSAGPTQSHRPLFVSASATTSPGARAPKPETTLSTLYSHIPRSEYKGKISESTGQQAPQESGDGRAEGRPRVGVVLSGGGAKGVAHIGALRVIEQAGIPIDIVVGTSMGAIVGGLYSIGYTPDQLDSMVMTQDWGLLLSDRTHRRAQIYSERENNDKYLISYPFGKKLEAFSGLIEGRNLETLFNDLMVGHHDSIDYDRLPIPFACVAANVVDGSTVVMRNGILPMSMRASMAIPGAFTPVYIDDMVLVDGGIVNNFPTDVAREMGADVIIGVDVQSALRDRNQLGGTADVLGQIVDLAMQRGTYRRNVSLADVYVKVDVSGYSSASFNLPALDSLIRRGKEATLSHRDDLANLKREMGFDDDYVPRRHEPFLSLSKRGDFHVYKISFESLTPRQRQWVMRKCGIEEDSDMNVRMLNHCMTVLGATTSHSDIYYSLRDTLGGYNLDIHMDAIKGNVLSAGVFFDSEEIASVIANGTFRFGGETPMMASVTGRFGRRMMAGVDWSLLASPLSSFKFSYAFDHSNVNVDSGGRRFYSPTWNHHRAGISFVNMNFVRQNLRMELGTAWQRYNFVSWLIDDHRDFGEEIPPDAADEQFVSYFARLDYETLDSRYFTRSGTLLSLQYELFTDNFYQYREHAPFMALSVSWKTAFPISRRMAFIPSFYGRVLMGNDVPFPMQNMIGGKHFGRYLPQQMPFDGVGFMEVAPGSFLAARAQLRHRIARRHYVSASFNYGLGGDNFLKILADGRNYFGASLDYGYDLRNFPLRAALSWSNVTSSLGFYFQAGYLF